MTLEQLHQLETIERLGTISAAAEELSISQSAVSRSIQQLEAELGQSLFTRTRNRVELNEFGRLATGHARAILAEERRMLDTFDSLNNRSRMLRVVSCAPSAVVELSDYIASWFPGTFYDTTILDAVSAHKRLISRTADLVITNRPSELPTIISVPFMVEDLYLLAPSEHELAGREFVSFSDLDGELLLMDKTAISWADTMKQLMPSSTFVEQTDLNVIVELIRTTDLLTFANDYSPLFEGLESRTRVKISDPEARAVYYLQCLTDGNVHAVDIVERAKETVKLEV